MNCKTAVVTWVTGSRRHIEEWIHHYIYFKFDQIYIATYRCSNETRARLEKISTTFEQVKIECIDWLDKGVQQEQHPSPEMCAYPFLFNLLRRNNPEITHALAVNSNEYWYPDPEVNKKNLIVNSKKPLDYFVVPVLPQSRPFSADQFFGNNNRLEAIDSRSIINMDSSKNMVRFSLPAPIFSGSVSSEKSDSGFVIQRKSIFNYPQSTEPSSKNLMFYVRRFAKSILTRSPAAHKAYNKYSSSFQKFKKSSYK